MVIAVSVEIMGTMVNMIIMTITIVRIMVTVLIMIIIIPEVIENIKQEQQ